MIKFDMIQIVEFSLLKF